MSEKGPLYILVHQQPNQYGHAYIIDLHKKDDVDWLRKLLGAVDNAEYAKLKKEVEQLRSARFNLQRAILPQLTALCKEEMLRYIKETYGTKAFKGDAVRNHFDEWYGFGACLAAVHDLTEEGKLTYKRGWHRLAAATTKQVT